MAGNAVIGALRVVLGADTAELEKGLKSASSSLTSFASKIQGIVAVAGIAAIGTSLASSFKGAVDQADKLSKSSQKIGIPIEQLSALKYAADLSDVSMESLEKSVGKLSKTMTEAAAKPTSEAANAFRALGVSVTDGNGKLRPTQEVLLSIADKFEGLKDGAGKTAVAMALFGRAGADMIPLLNSGKRGIQEMMDEAKKFGIVISAETGKSAEEFNDNLKRMHTSQEGMIMQITARMLPGMASLSNLFVDVSKNMELMNGVGKVLSISLQGLTTAAYAIGAAFKVLYLEFSTFMRAVAAAVTGDFSGAWKIVQDGISNSISTMQGASKSIKDIWTGANDGANGAAIATDKATKSQKDFNYAAMGGKNAIDSYIDGIKKRIAGLQAELPLIGKSNEENERAKIVSEGIATAIANRIPVTDALRQRLNLVATEQARLNELVTFGKQTFDATQTPLEQYQQTIERLNISLQGGAINSDTYARAVAQAQDKMVQANPYAQALGSSLESAFSKAIEGGTSLREVLAGLLKDLARAMANAAFKQLLYGTASSGGGFSGILGSLFGGFRAGGGPVMPNTAYVVGERGPELFMPGASGQVISNADLTGAGRSGGGLAITQNLHFQPGMSGTDMALVGQAMSQMKNEIFAQMPGFMKQGFRNDPHFAG